MTERRTRSRIAFANYQAACSGSLTNFEPYLLACRFLQCGIIDRTNTLKMGFKTHVLDPLDEVYSTTESDGDFSSLCDQRAEEILDLARKQDCSIDVLWSGGIDSTVALTALLQATKRVRETERLRIFLSVGSISEYPAFFHQYIKEQLRWTPVGFPIARYLSPDSITVTGEHGDLLFGDSSVQPLIPNGIAYLPWRTGVPLLLAQREFTGSDSDTLMDYLTPLVDSCPIEIDSVFEFYWWMNFTQMWQNVALRIAASVESKRTALFENTQHFFRSIPFQLWALFGRERETMEEWCQYKMAAKDYIYDFNADDEFRDCKEKQHSLRHLMSSNSSSGPHSLPAWPTPEILALDEQFETVLEFETSSSSDN